MKEVDPISYTTFSLKILSKLFSKACGISFCIPLPHQQTRFELTDSALNLLKNFICLRKWLFLGPFLEQFLAECGIAQKLQLFSRRASFSRGLIVLLLFFPFLGNASPFDEDDLLAEVPLYRDLAIVERVNREIKDKLPLIVNYNFQGGYFVMPSARLGEEGSGSIGWASVPPYQIYGISLQLFNHLELSFNYWVYQNLPDEVLGAMGFGNRADRTGSLRLCLLRKEDGFDFLPEITFGANDFFGSKAFTSYYLVATESFLSSNLELTLGWGSGRISGFFGGIGYSPFRKKNSLLKGFTLAIEYDANDYAHNKDEHPDGRSVKIPVNIGCHYTLFDILQLSVSSIRGQDLAYALSLRYDFGLRQPFVSKTKDPPPYSGPLIKEPIGMLRDEQFFAEELALKLASQGLDLYSAKLIRKKESTTLWVRLINMRYREECQVRMRAERVLGAILPDNIDHVILVIESEGIPLQQYCYRKEDLRRYAKCQMGDFEMATLSPRRDVASEPSCFEATTLLHRTPKLWSLLLRPRFYSFFGSSRGKFKYELSLITGLNGYLFKNWYYDLLTSYSIKSSIQDVGSCDILNPSQIFNVRTDSILYAKSGSFHVEKLFAQHSRNLGHGFFGRIGAGYFEKAYGGLAAELLYYPAWANFAIGVEAALVKKRSYYGMGFVKEIRKYKGSCPEMVSFPYTLQYFLEFYYNYPEKALDFDLAFGRFLARDMGVKIESGKTFASGVRLYFWITFTNGGDVVNNSRYYDKGVGFSIPLDLFSPKSSKQKLGYAISEWLRDVGARAETGRRLYSVINEERR